MRINRKLCKIIETIGYPKKEMSGKRNRKTFKKAYKNRSKLSRIIFEFIED